MVQALQIQVVDSFLGGTDLSDIQAIGDSGLSEISICGEPEGEAERTPLRVCVQVSG